MNRRIRKLLYRSLDGPLAWQESEQLEQALHWSEELVDEYRQLGALRRQLAKSKTAGFKPFFAERVAARLMALNRPQELFYTALMRTFRRVLVVAVLCMVVLAAYQLYDGPESHATAMAANLDDMVSTVFTPSLEDIL